MLVSFAFLFYSVFTIAAEEQVIGPLTSDFQKYIERQGNSQYLLNVVKHYGFTGSFGGRQFQGQTIKNTPVVFIHGNSDSALDVGTAEAYTGWTRQIAYFLERGYSTAELYAITYGDRNINHSMSRTLSCEDLQGHKKFVETVLEYTEAPTISIVGHSMGVTLARSIIHGGKLSLNGEVCNLGRPLLPYIDTLLSIASANHGMCICQKFDFVKACSNQVGFYPGVCADQTSDCSSASTECKIFEQPMSALLRTINKHPKDAEFVFSLWSTGDEVLGKGGNAVWGRQTSVVPHSDRTFRFTGLSHFQLKTETVKEQYHLIRYKLVPRDYFLH